MKFLLILLYLMISTEFACADIFFTDGLLIDDSILGPARTKIMRAYDIERSKPKPPEEWRRISTDMNPAYNSLTACEKLSDLFLNSLDTANEFRKSRPSVNISDINQLIESFYGEEAKKDGRMVQINKVCPTIAKGLDALYYEIIINLEKWRSNQNEREYNMLRTKGLRKKALEQLLSGG